MMFCTYAFADLQPNKALTQQGSCSNKNSCKSICLGVHIQHIRCINIFADHNSG